jgi:hypothetical protein
MDSAIVPNTRASRGLGEGLLELYVAKLNHTVVASVRDPNHGTTEAPTELPTAEGYALLIIKVDSTIQADAADGVKQLTANGIDHIDIIIINTSIAYAWPKASEVRVDNMKEHMSVCLCGYPTLSSHSSLVENDLKALSEAHPQHILRYVDYTIH